MKYYVGIREVWVREILVEANDEDEAKRKARDKACASGDDDNLEYSYELDENLWSVDEEVE